MTDKRWKDRTTEGSLWELGKWSYKRHKKPRYTPETTNTLPHQRKKKDQERG